MLISCGQIAKWVAAISISRRAIFGVAGTAGGPPPAIEEQLLLSYKITNCPFAASLWLAKKSRRLDSNLKIQMEAHGYLNGLTQSRICKMSVHSLQPALGDSSDLVGHDD